jgi:hypothetical protein
MPWSRCRRSYIVGERTLLSQALESASDWPNCATRGLSHAPRFTLLYPAISCCLPCTVC